MRRPIASFFKPVSEAHRTLNARERALVLCVGAAAVVVIGFAFPLPAAMASLLFAGFLILWANPTGLPALAILWIQAVNFRQYGVDVDPAREFDNAVMIGGLPMTLQLFTLIVMTARGSAAWLVRKQQLAHRRWLDWGFWMWAAFFLITIASSVWGRSLGYSNWTQPLRASMAMGCGFYGLMIAPQFRKTPWVADWLLTVGVVVLLMVITGLYWNHVVFFYLALGMCAFWYALRQKKWLLAVAAGITPINALLGKESLTMMGCVLLGLILGYGWFYTPRGASGYPPRWTRLVIPVAFVLTLVLVGVVLFTAYAPEFMPGPVSNLGTRFLFKLYLDRGVLWRAAWSDIIESPDMLSPAGRPLVILSPFFSLPDNLWTVHVHNSFLEILRQTGIPGGILFLGLVVAFWRKVRDVMFDVPYPAVRVFAGAVLISIVVGAATGIWPFDFHAGPWTWLWAGLTLGLAGSRDSAQPRLRPRIRETPQARPPPRVAVASR